MTASQAQVLEDVTGFLAEVVGDDFEMMGPITLDTSFSQDLELESIEFVALAELVQGRYGDRIDFVGWLSAKSLDDIIGLRVADLVDFIVSCPT